MESEKELKRLILLALFAWYSSVFHAVRFGKEIDWKREKEEFLDSLKAAILVAIGILGEQEKAYWKERGKEFESDDQAIWALFLVTAGSRLQRIVDLTERATRLEIERYLAQNESLDVLAERLQQWYGDKRAQRIAQYENGQASTATIAYVARQLDSKSFIWKHGAVCATGPCLKTCMPNEGKEFQISDLSLLPAHPYCDCYPELVF